MNKRFLVLLPILALGALSACGGKTPAQKANDGKSAETAYTVEEMIGVMANYEGGQISQEEYYVTATLAEGTTYDSNYGSWTAYDVVHHKDAEKPFQFYSCQMDESITKNYKANGCLDGAKIVVKGYVQLYQPQAGDPVYEICYLSKSKSPTGEATSPVILSVEGGKEYVQPDATAIAIGEDFELEVEQTKTLKATFTPADGKHDDVVWSSNNAEIAAVSENGVVTAVAKGEATITATAGSLTASVKVTVKDKPEVITSATLTPENLLNWNGTDNVAYAADEIESTIAGLKFGAAGCGVYGNGIQMRTNATTGTSAFYNKDAIPGGIAKITLNWAASKDVSVKDYHLFVEFSNSADFGTLVGEKINAKFTEKALELTPTASATFFRVTHANMGAVYLDSVVIDFVVE